ncbi:hypothetical protein GUJ93_ZPchr0007g3695 [Zizania palustris]|uniref:Transcription factor TFIIB cyclin-like domain-containing protein n=1 Tax=Zizania palustris TaxID=103762 RepID=A0A8J5SQV9_ZIZPA|nr:hypothetical protein GUJ93_ZPchr0007g3695 [Zizania palustris]
MFGLSKVGGLSAVCWMLNSYRVVSLLSNKAGHIPWLDVSILKKKMGAAVDAAGRLNESLDVRRNPQSIAAALIYMAMQRSRGSKTVRDVSAATGVSASTIKDACRDLSAHSELLFS